METNAALIGIVLLVGLMVVLVEWITRHDGRGIDGDRERRTSDVSDADSPLTAMNDLATGDEPVVAHVFERADLLDVDHLQGMELIDDLLLDLVETVLDEQERPKRRPRPPTNVLLYGPPGVGMTVLAHTLARQFGARMVQIYASAVIPITYGGSQPVIAPVVAQAKDRQPSVLFIDELETLAGDDVQDVRCQRAANDLLNECLRPVYGGAPVVIAAFTSYGGRPLPRRLARAFDHVVWVDVPVLERALVRDVTRASHHGLRRVMPAGRIAERADVPSTPPTDAAAA